MEVARKEQWRPVDGYEGRYSVSDHGRVRSEARRVPNNANGSTRGVRERMLKQNPDGGGYLCVWLCTPGEPHKVKKVADLVLAAFNGPKPPGLEVLHGDGVQTNNHRRNLRYGTRVENMADAKRHGTWPRGENHGQARLTDAEVREIIADTRPSIIIAFERGITYGHVRALKTGRRRTMPKMPPSRNSLDIPQKDQPRQSAPVPKPTGNMPRSVPKSSKTKPKIVPKGNGTPPKGLR